jgi:phosphate transport system protein
MTQIDHEIQEIKDELIELWELVNSQLVKANTALVTVDKDLAREIIAAEKKVNSLELKLERNSENVIALFNPVAMDLRFILAVLKINTNLERTADIAAGLAKFIKETEEKFDKNLIEEVRIKEMFDIAISMMEDTLVSFDQEDSKSARQILKSDESLDKINKKSNKIIAEYCRNNPDNIEFALYVLNCIRKLERVGDQAKNMAEEVIFFIEAKVLRHKNIKKNKK